MSAVENSHVSHHCGQLVVLTVVATAVHYKQGTLWRCKNSRRSIQGSFPNGAIVANYRVTKITSLLQMALSLSSLPERR